MVIVTFDDLRSDRLLALSIEILNELERIKQQKEELQHPGGVVDGNAADRNVRKQQPFSLQAMLTSQQQQST